MPLPTPMPALVLNTRLNGVTFLTQEGSGFNNTSTVTLEDLNATPADRYVFACTVVQDTPKRLLFKATCTAVPTHTASFAKVKVTVTTGGASDDTNAVPVRLSTRLEPVVHQNRIPRAQLRRSLAAGNDKSVMFLPADGFGEPGDIINTCVVTKQPSGGTWTVVRARQLNGRVKITLRCTAISAGEGGGTTTDTLSVTLSASDETTITSPPIEVVYVNDPDDTPE